MSAIDTEYKIFRDTIGAFNMSQVPATGIEECDIFIIGAGAVGVAVAREFTLMGRKCVICEKNSDVLGEASSGNTGHVGTNFYYTKDRAPLEFALTRLASKEINPKWLQEQPNVPRKMVSGP